MNKLYYDCDSRLNETLISLNFANEKDENLFEVSDP